MPAVLLTVLYLVVLCAASAAWQFGHAGAPRTTARPWAVLVAVVVIGAPSLLQLTLAPGLLAAWERNAAATTDGQIWRLVTALVVQDGGWVGTVFNLAILMWIGVMAEVAWGSRRWVVIAVCSGVGAQLWGWLVQPVGAGNSVVVFGLAASLLVRGMAGGSTPSRVAGIVGLLAALVLLVGGDIHGGASAIGALVAVVLLRHRGDRVRFSARGGGAPGR